MKVWKVAAAAWLALFIIAGQAHAAERFTPAKRHTFCRYQSWSQASRGYTDAEVRMTIDCATDHFPVSGGDVKAFSIANRESGFECKANNPSSSAGGVFQVVFSTWYGAAYADGWWDRHGGYLNAHGWRLKSHSRYACRPNIMVSIRAAHTDGWGAWGG